METEIFKYRIRNILVFRPSVINGDRNEKRVIEKISVLFLSLIKFILIGPLRKYRSIKSNQLASIMLKSVKELNGNQIIYQDRFDEL